MMYVYGDYKEAADYIEARIGDCPETAIILGSGLGAFADSLTGTVEIPYAEIPNFRRSTVESHKGALIAGYCEGKRVIAMCGRFHYYEGYAMEDTAFPIGVMKLLGVRNLIITNAAGGINAAYTPGDLVCVNDHIKLAPQSPVRGPNIPEFGERFFDMQSVYSRRFIEIAKESAAALGFNMDEGVYAYMSGPQFETPAEIRMLAALGADLVGMSTVAEVIMAAQCGISVLCVSCVTNYAAGLGEVLLHADVCEVGEKTKDRFSALMSAVIGKI